MPRSDSGYSRCVSARGHGHLVGFGGGDVDAYPAQRGVHTVALAPLTNMHWAVANSEQPTHGTDASPSCEQLSRLTRLLIRGSVYQAHTRVLQGEVHGGRSGRRHSHSKTRHARAAISSACAPDGVMRVVDCAHKR